MQLSLYKTTRVSSCPPCKLFSAGLQLFTRLGVHGGIRVEHIREVEGHGLTGADEAIQEGRQPGEDKVTTPWRSKTCFKILSF